MMFRASRPQVQFSSSAVNVAMDGNSLVEGNGASSAGVVTKQLSNFQPLVGSGINVKNVGVGGQTTRAMNGLDGGSTTDIDAAFDASKALNILLAWEITNSVQSLTRTGVQAVADMEEYCRARKQVHPWKIILMGTIPRYQDYGANNVPYLNQQLLIADSLMKNYRAVSADGFVNMRVAGGPFDFSNWDLSTFDRALTKPLWATTDDPGIRVHLSDVGYAYVAARVADYLATLRM